MRDPLALSGCVVHIDLGRVQRSGLSTPLTGQEVALLRHLVARLGQTVSRDELYAEALGYASETRSRALDTAIRRLRSKIEDDPSDPVHLLTVHGEGYRFVAPPTVPMAPATPRPPAPPLFGRDPLLREIAARVALPGLLTLHGPGGVGKTTLAGAVLHDEPTVVHAVVAPGMHNADVRHVVKGALHPVARSGVLWIDSAEAALDAVATVVQELLTSAPQLRMVVTSREPLALPGEQVIVVPPLSPDAATALFEARVAEVRSIPWPDATPARLRDISMRLDGLPLAIELAASRANVLSARVLQLRLDDRFSLLARTRRGGPSHHTALYATLAWSWDLLDADGRSALVALSVFDNPFPFTAAEAVLGDDALDRVERLVSQSLVCPVDTAGQLTLLDSIRAFARTWQDHAPWGHVAEVARGRLALEGHRLRLGSTDQIAATNRALEQRLPTATDSIVAAIDAGALRVAPAHQLDHWLQHLRQLAPLRQTVRTWTAQGSLLVARGHVMEAITAFRQATADPEQPDAADAWLPLGMALLERGAFEEATAALTSARHAWPQGGTPWARATMLLGLAVRDAHGDLDGADVLLHEALHAFGAQADARGCAVTQANLAHSAYRRGRLHDAIEWARRGAETLDTLGDLRGAMQAQQNLGVLLDRVGNLREAEACFDRALQHAEHLGNRAGAARAMANRAITRSHRGSLRTARQELDEALSLAQSVGVQPLEALIELFRARLAMRCHDDDAALGAVHRAMELAQAAGAPDLEAEVRAVRATLTVRTDPDAAMHDISTAITLCEQSSDTGLLGTVVALAGVQVARATGHASDAATHLARATELVAHTELPEDAPLAHQLRELTSPRAPAPDGTSPATRPPRSGTTE